MTALARRVRSMWRSRYRPAVTAVAITAVAVSTMPRIFQESRALWLTGAVVTVALMLYRWHALRQRARRNGQRIRHKDRAAIIISSMKPLNLVARSLAILTGAIQLGSWWMINDRLAKHDQLGYFTTQTFHAYSTDPDGLRRAQVLSIGAFGPVHPDCGARSMVERKHLMKDEGLPDAFRSALLRTDAVCERGRDEVAVADDLRKIHAMPFDVLNPQFAALTDAFFGLQDYEAAILLGRSASPAGRKELRTMAEHTRDQKLRHVIRLALST